MWFLTDRELLFLLIGLFFSKIVLIVERIVINEVRGRSDTDGYLSIIQFLRQVRVGQGVQRSKWNFSRQSPEIFDVCRKEIKWQNSVTIRRQFHKKKWCHLNYLNLNELLVPKDHQKCLTSWFHRTVVIDVFVNNNGTIYGPYGDVKLSLL